MWHFGGISDHFKNQFKRSRRKLHMVPLKLDTGYLFYAGVIFIKITCPLITNDILTQEIHEIR